MSFNHSPDSGTSRPFERIESEIAKGDTVMIGCRSVINFDS